MPRNPNCTDCPLHETTDNVCVWGDGPDNANIFVVGEAPGRNEARTGKPFTGQSGQLLRAELVKNDLMEDTYITNAVKCRPPDNRTPTPQEIKACKKYLEQEIAEHNPEYVVTAGVVPTKTLFRGKAKINQVHGELIASDKVDYIGMPVFHPAYTLRDPSKTPGFQNDIRRLSEVYYGEEEDSTVNWNVVRRGNVNQFLSEFEIAPDFAFDLETSGLFMHGEFRYVTAICIAMEHRTWVIPGFMHPDFMQYCKSPWVHGEALKMLMQILFAMAEQTDKKAYAQNGKFDNLWLMRMFGGKFRLEFDTMLAHHLIDENVAHDLTSLCRTYLHEPEYDIPLKEKQGKSKKPMRNFKYCAQDGTYTYRLVKIFRKELAKDRAVERLFYKLVMPAARALEDIEMEGLTIDLEQMADTGLDILSRKIKVNRELNELVGREINWNSPAQVGKVLYKELKLRCRHKTAKGNPSTSEEAVLDLKGKHKVVDLLIEYRELAKFHSTYIMGFKKKMVGNKLYVSYKIHGTVTGRYSCPLHSIPRDGSIRNLVTAPPGWEFVQGDVSQAELRVIAHMSGDPEMRRCFTKNIDIHWRTLTEELKSGGQGEYVDPVIETAEKHSGRKMNFAKAADYIAKIGPDEAIEVWGGWKEGRKKAKAINFGYVYGMWPKKFIQTAKTKYGWEPTMEEAEASRSNYFRLYFRLEPWHKRQKSLVKMDGFVRNPSGRIRHLPGIHAKDRGVRMEAERQAINAPVQGFIGDFKAMAMVEIHETVDRNKLRVVGEHHDAVLMIVRKSAKNEVLPKVARILKRPKLLKTLKVNLSIPMESDLEVGPWGKGKVFVEK